MTRWTPPDSSRDHSLPSINTYQASISDLSSRRTEPGGTDERSPTNSQSDFQFLSTLSESSGSKRQGGSRKHGSTNLSSLRTGPLGSDISSLRFESSTPKRLEDFRPSASTAINTEVS